MSKMFKLNLNDFAKGLVVAFVGAGILVVYNFLQKCGFTCIEWEAVLNAALVGGVGYLIKNFLTDENNKLGGRL